MRIPGWVLLGWQFDLRSRKGFKRGGAMCAPGCVLLGRQCDLSSRKGFKRGGAMCTLGVFCSAGNVIGAPG